MLVEPLPVEILHAVDPHGPEQPEVFVEQAELHRDVAHGRVEASRASRFSSREVSQTSRPSEPRKRVRIGEANRAMRSRPTPRTWHPGRDVEVGEQRRRGRR